MWESKGDKYYRLELCNATAWRTLIDLEVCPCPLIADDTGLTVSMTNQEESISWGQKVGIVIYGLCSFQTLCRGHGYLLKGTLVNWGQLRPAVDPVPSETEQTPDWSAHPAFSFAWYVGHSAKSRSCLVENFAFLIRKNNFSCLFFHSAFLL